MSSIIEDIKDVKGFIDSLENLEGNQYKLIKTSLNNYLNGIRVLIEKGHDYATTDDPFKNFRLAEAMGQAVPKTIVFECAKKLARIANIIDMDSSKVKNEPLEDNLLDTINYLNLALSYILMNRVSAEAKKPVEKIKVEKPTATKINATSGLDLDDIA